MCRSTVTAKIENAKACAARDDGKQLVKVRIRLFRGTVLAKMTYTMAWATGKLHTRREQTSTQR